MPNGVDPEVVEEDAGAEGVAEVASEEAVVVAGVVVSVEAVGAVGVADEVVVSAVNDSKQWWMILFSVILTIF